MGVTTKAELQAQKGDRTGVLIALAQERAKGAKIPAKVQAKLERDALVVSFNQKLEKTVKATETCDLLAYYDGRDITRFVGIEAQKLEKAFKLPTAFPKGGFAAAVNARIPTMNANLKAKCTVGPAREAPASAAPMDAELAASFEKLRSASFKGDVSAAYNVAYDIGRNYPDFATQAWTEVAEAYLQHASRSGFSLTSDERANVRRMPELMARELNDEETYAVQQARNVALHGRSE